MRRADRLITEVRRRTGNEAYGANEGIRDNQIVLMLDEASRMLQGSILRNIIGCYLFDEQTTLTTVAYQRAYGLPGSSTYAGTPTQARRPLYNNAIRLVEHSQTGNVDDYDVLDPKVLRELSVAETDPPAEYSIVGTDVYLSPVPNTSGKLVRITYPSAVDAIDLPRATVASTTTASTYYTTIVFNAVTASSENEEALLAADYICICDSLGNLIYRNIRGSYNSSTYTWTITGTTTLTATATISAGDVVTVGKDSSSYPDKRWPDEVERFLIGFAAWRIMKQESNADATELGGELTIIETDILQNLGASIRDAMHVPILDDAWLQ